MPDRNLQLVRRLYAAQSRGDHAAVLAALDPAVRWDIPARRAPAGAGVRGTAAVAERLTARDRRFHRIACTPEAYHAFGDMVVVLGHYHLVRRGNGRALRRPFVHVVTLQDGRVTGAHEFTDTAAFTAAMVKAA